MRKSKKTPLPLPAPHRLRFYVVDVSEKEKKSSSSSSVMSRETEQKTDFRDWKGSLAAFIMSLQVVVIF